MPYISYGDSSSELMHDDSPRHSWDLGGNPHIDMGACRASDDSGYASGYVNYLFAGSNGGFLNNQLGKFVRSIYDAFDYDAIFTFHVKLIQENYMHFCTDYNAH